MIDPRSSFVDAENVHLRYLEWDSAPGALNTETEVFDATDTIPLILLHGLGATADTWSLVAKELRKQHQVIAFDLRGHGQSDQPDDGYDLVTIAEDVICAMAKLGFGQVAVVAHGWGARVALVLAARHPALVSHLILVDCPHVEPRHWPGMTRERFIHEKSPETSYASMNSYLDSWRTEMSTFWTPDLEAIVLTYIRELPDGSVEDRLLPEHQVKIRASLWEDRALSYYGKLACPVLLVPAADKPHPGEDLPEHLEDADEFAAAKAQMAAQVSRAIQRCTVLWMPATSHDIQLQRPQTLAQSILNFLNDV
jgi:pimeloyl-ACP methyl ester carboxylesterase